MQNRGKGQTKRTEKNIKYKIKIVFIGNMHNKSIRNYMEELIFLLLIVSYGNVHRLVKVYSLHHFEYLLYWAAALVIELTDNWILLTIFIKQK